jgi:predicted nucleic acid-binding protein
VIVHIDTSALVDALTGSRRSLDRLTALVADGHRIAVSTIVLYEWLRGPRTEADLAAQQELLPREDAVPFGLADAELAAHLYGAVRRPRGREIDLAVAACAISGRAALWTLNHADFADIPGLKLI